MKELPYTHRNHDSTGPINEPCPYGVHFEDDDKVVFHIGSTACKERCAYSLLNGVRPHSAKNTVLCTADEEQPLCTSICAD